MRSQQKVVKNLRIVAIKRMLPTKRKTLIKDNKQKQSNTPKQNNRNQKQQTQSDNNQQKVEKANSKIEKRTFND